MGFKKRMKYRLLESALSKSRMGSGGGMVGASGVSKWIKRLIAAVAVFCLLTVIGTLALVGYTYNKVSSMMNSGRDVELMALEQLIRNKSITLAEEQKARLAPIVKNLTEPGLSPEQKNIIKEQMWDVLNPAQVRDIRAWAVKTEKDADNLVDTATVPLLEAVRKYTGISGEQLQDK